MRNGSESAGPAKAGTPYRGGMSPQAQMRVILGILILLGLALVPATVVSLSTYESVAEMAANANPDAFFKVAWARGYSATGDGGGGMFYATNTVTATNLGTRIKAVGHTKSWERHADRGITPDDFGAKGDGTTDDTTAINAWLVAGWNHGHYVPAKVYAFGNLTLAVSGREIYGIGTFKKLSADTGQWLVWTGNNIKIRDITFDANHATKTMVNVGNYSTNWIVSGVRVKGVQNNASTGIATDVTDCFVAGRGCRDFVFERNYFSDVDSTYAPGAGTSGLRCIRFGIPATIGTDWTNDRFDNIRVIDCTFDTIGPTQLDADPVVIQNQVPDANGFQVANALIQRNIFRNCGRRAIKLECGGAIVEGNDIYSSLAGPVGTSAMFAGISVYGPKAVVSNNKIHGGCYQFGIEVTWLTAFGQPFGVVINGNTIDTRIATRTGSYGIVFKGCKQCSASGNQIYGTDFGISVGGNCSGITLADNSTDHILDYGIVVQTLSAGAGESFGGTPDAINISGGVLNSDAYSIFLSAATDTDVNLVKGAAGTQFFFRNTGVTGMNFFGKRVESAAADQVISNTTTLADATGLAVPLVANRKYRYRAVIVVDNAGTTAGVKLAMAGPASPTKVTLVGFLENATTTVVHQVATSLTTIIAQGVGTTGVKYAVLEGVIFNGANAADLKVQIAQNTADAVNATTLKAGSYLEVERIN